jgi:hypothetical protein
MYWWNPEHLIEQRDYESAGTLVNSLMDYEKDIFRKIWDWQNAIQKYWNNVDLTKKEKCIVSLKSDHLKKLRDRIPKGRIGAKTRLKILLEFIITKNGLIQPF